MMDNAQILELLKSVKYPGFSRDIVSFGLIKEITIKDDAINIDIALKTQNQDSKDKVIADIEAKLSNLFKEVNIQIINESPNNPQANPSTDQNKFNLNNIKNIIAIASGKGGVGKSTVAANVALALRENNNSVGLLDLDIYGPSLLSLIHI